MAMRIPLPAGWGEAWLHEPGEHQSKTGRTIRSYDHHGRQLVWSPAKSVARDSVAGNRHGVAGYTPERFACDIEDASRPSSDLARQFGVTEPEFRRRWVVTEVLAKLHDVPILVWLKQRGLSEGDRDGARIFVRESTTTGSVAAFGLLEKTGKD